MGAVATDPAARVAGRAARAVTPVPQVVQRVIARHLLDHAGLETDEDRGGAVVLIQRFGSSANRNVHLHCVVLDQ